MRMLFKTIFPLTAKVIQIFTYNLEVDR